MFKGSNVALITPFKDNIFDHESYLKIINFHLNNGTNGLVPVGTTGESPTLSQTTVFAVFVVFDVFVCSVFLCDFWCWHWKAYRSVVWRSLWILNMANLWVFSYFRNPCY